MDKDTSEIIDTLNLILAREGLPAMPFEAARRLIDLLVEVLAGRLETGPGEAAAGIASSPAVSSSIPSSTAPRPEPQSATDTARDMQEPPEPDSIPS